VVDGIGTVAPADVTASAVSAEDPAAPLRPVGRQPSLAIGTGPRHP